ncbi:MAG: bifunctional UDP-N-acetylglucosamine diphosphorylase/glucosamine-1-phosphate N-acetyltransferase GlmU [Fimbriimonadaceae bacterium]|nr:bifunctional UDP-N-acetylglucosamine diphosphorylase/glucosamine-1-phosphate N-acetyltransferase GlmU [Fimbriimonadaceae bacterium]
MSDESKVYGIILAAGLGTRMNSKKPKCLHEVCGVPMVRLALKACSQAGVDRSVVVVGHGADDMMAELGDTVDYARQMPQNGTGHAVEVCRDAFAGRTGEVIVTCGDMPLVKAETMRALVEARRETGAACVIASVDLKADAGSYGRIIRDRNGEFKAIVEADDCDPMQRQVTEINSAVYCFDVETLFRLLPEVKPKGRKGEIYLTEVPRLIRDEGGKVEVVVFSDVNEFQGVNDRMQLAEAAKFYRRRILRRHAANGVMIVDPDSTYIEGDVVIGQDTTIQPMTVIEGRTVIGQDCQIGPNTWIKDSEIHDNVRIFMSHLDRAKMERGSRCGPFANLRPDAELGEEVKVGNFVEIKKSQIGPGTSISHLTYIGDAHVGSRVNIGAGTITCNYDGYAKHVTRIGDGAFIGSNSTLVAPVTIGDRAMTAAGSVVTRGVPDDSLAIGRSRQEIKEEWVTKWKASRKGTE